MNLLFDAKPQNVYSDTPRYLNPSDINIPREYQIEVYAQGLNSPISMAFTDSGDMLIAESGLTSSNPKIIRLSNGRFETVAEGFQVPVTGVNYYKGKIYVSHRGVITSIAQDGTKQDIITGLPSNGDYTNNKVIFGPDGKLYFGQGTATNSGVVGLDNKWIEKNALFHDEPGSYIMLKGQNFKTENSLIAGKETVTTGAFSSFGVPNMPYETRKAVVKASGSVLRANLDGSDLELVAWGFRDPVCLKFDRRNRLFVSNQGYSIRGSRPIANAPDEFFLITPDIWYGWPDFAGGDPVTLSRFTPEGGIQPELLLENYPNVPPKPFATFPPNSAIMGFDFNYYSNFGDFGNVFIAEFGSYWPKAIDDTTPYTGAGHRISKVDMSTNSVTTFAINKSGFPSSVTNEGGFGRPTEVLFGPDGAMYILDLGTNESKDLSVFLPNTGVIWRMVHLS